MEQLHQIGASVASAPESHYAELFLELYHLLKRVPVDEALLLQTWQLGLPHLIMDCMEIGVQAEDLHTYACLCSLFIDFASLAGIDITEVQVSDV